MPPEENPPPPPADPPAPPANPPPAPPANPPANPPADPPGDHVSRDEFATFSRTVTESLAGLTTAVTALTNTGKDSTPTDVPWTHRGGRRRDDA